jgi:hypothetical protein
MDKARAMTKVAEFEIQGLPMTINAIGRKHWSFKMKEAKRWKNLVLEQCVFMRIYGINLGSAVLVLTRHSSQESDFDGLASSFKHVIDGLVLAKVIVDDKPSIIGSPTYIWKKAPKGQGKITIEILSDESVHGV